MIEVTIVTLPRYVLLNWFPPEDVGRGVRRRWPRTCSPEPALWAPGFLLGSWDTVLPPAPAQAALVLSLSSPNSSSLLSSTENRQAPPPLCLQDSASVLVGGEGEAKAGGAAEEGQGRGSAQRRCQPPAQLPAPASEAPPPPAMLLPPPRAPPRKTRGAEPSLCLHLLSRVHLETEARCLPRAVPRCPCLKSDDQGTGTTWALKSTPNHFKQRRLWNIPLVLTSLLYPSLFSDSLSLTQTIALPPNWFPEPQWDVPPCAGPPHLHLGVKGIF